MGDIIPRPWKTFLEWDTCFHTPWDPKLWISVTLFYVHTFPSYSAFDIRFLRFWHPNFLKNWIFETTWNKFYPKGSSPLLDRLQSYFWTFVTLALTMADCGINYPLSFPWRLNSVIINQLYCLIKTKIV